MSHSERLKELGFELPETVKPLAAYVPAVRTGNLVYTAGQLPLHGGDLSKPGKVGAEVTTAEAKAMARICAFNALSAVDSLVGHRRDRPHRQGGRLRGVSAWIPRPARGGQRCV